MPFSSGVLSINDEGQAIYTSQHRSTTAQQLEPSSYVMSTSADILCHVTDDAGNLFQVSWTNYYDLSCVIALISVH